MATALRDSTNRKRPVQSGTLLGVRLQPEQLAALDAWIDAQPEPRPSRPAAVRNALQGFLSIHGAIPSRPI